MHFCLSGRDAGPALSRLPGILRMRSNSKGRGQNQHRPSAGLWAGSQHRPSAGLVGGVTLCKEGLSTSTCQMLVSPPACDNHRRTRGPNHHPLRTSGNCTCPVVPSWWRRAVTSWVVLAVRILEARLTPSVTVGLYTTPRPHTGRCPYPA